MGNDTRCCALHQLWEWSRHGRHVETAAATSTKRQLGCPSSVGADLSQNRHRNTCLGTTVPCWPTRSDRKHKFQRGIVSVRKKLRTHAGWDWSRVDHSGTIGLWWAAANASPLTFHQSENMSGTNPAMPTAYNRALNSRSHRRRRTFYTQSGVFGLLRCTCVRSSWKCRYGEQGNGAAPRDARAASFRESARSSRKRRTMRVAGASGCSRYAWIQIKAVI